MSRATVDDQLASGAEPARPVCLSTARWATNVKTPLGEPEMLAHTTSPMFGSSIASPSAELPKAGRGSSGLPVAAEENRGKQIMRR